jgi:Ran GTPase-activating protein (RanGAP) involved in mRNA processing and transport
MDVDTNTPRNGLHFWRHNYFCCLFFWASICYIAYSGHVSIDVRPIGADPTFFSFFYLFLFLVDAVPFPSDFLRNHVSSKLANASARLVCRQWSTALLVPILHLTTVKLKQVQVLSTLLPKCCAIDAHTLGIDVDGAKALADALKVNSSITSIDLHRNNVGVDGAKALADALKVNSTITSINLTYNNVDVDGSKALADALKVNSSITSINLSTNKVGVDGAKALADALKVNSSITSIYLTKNNVGDDGAKALADALKVNSTITSIDLRDNKVGVDGAKALAGFEGDKNTTQTSFFF